MTGRLAMWIGGIGAAVTALCCFTPLLPVVLGALGLQAALGFLYSDLILLPLLALFLALAVWGFRTRRIGAGE